MDVEDIPGLARDLAKRLASPEGREALRRKESPDADDLQEALEDFGVRVYSPESAGDFSVFVFSDKDLTDEQVVLACEEAGVGDLLASVGDEEG